MTNGNSEVSVVERLKGVFDKSFIKYVITGVTAFVIEYSMYVLLLKWIGLNYVLSSTLVYMIVFWFAFLVNRSWSFESKGDVKLQLMKYTMLFFFNLIVANVILMYFLTDIVGLSELLSPFIKTGCMVAWNYLIYKYYIYV